jgi:dTDP-4-dehydrorhamnose 3,5-epimerase
MKFAATAIPGVCVVELERHADPRGFFARAFCEREFQERGLETRFVQSSLSWNQRRGTLRGMHFQREPKPEVKLVRCVRGSVYDVVVDLRPESPAYRQWIGVELNGVNRRALYIPAGIAHGFETLEDDSELYYEISEFYEPGLAAGVRWDDPGFGIDWPIKDPILSDRDRGYADYAV